MKQKLLFTVFAAGLSIAAAAQQKTSRITAYAITAPEKGGNGWTEVKLIDLVTGETIQSVYESTAAAEPLNARTKNPVVKLDAKAKIPQKKMVLIPASLNKQTGEIIPERRIEVYATSNLKVDKPFATYSAACAYDKKHDRLYYTPMGINQLRYIDLKTNTIYYFENEPLGVLEGPGDIKNQVTRMVIASDGNGYALTNNSEHLVQFTTNKKAKITDLGALTDDAANGDISIRSIRGFGGDMVADGSGNLYVITANRNVFKVNIETKVARFVGRIKGLPDGFTTNGAAVENGNSIIISSATTTKAYYRFNLQDLQATQLSTAASVFNASDLANANLLSDKTNTAEDAKAIVTTTPAKVIVPEQAEKEKTTVYPNPVTNGVVKISFANYIAGEYELQLIDLTGKIISTQSVTLNSKTQIQDFKLPSLTAKGTYLLKVLNSNKIISTEKIIVE